MREFKRTVKSSGTVSLPELPAYGSCVYVRYKLPPEKYKVGGPPWINISDNLMDPVQSMVASRVKMKFWPVLVCCLSTGALHVRLVHSHGAEAFLLQ